MDSSTQWPFASTGFFVVLFVAGLPSGPCLWRLFQLLAVDVNRGIAFAVAVDTTQPLRERVDQLRALLHFAQHLQHLL